ncbi:MAG: hypothetical protein OXM02_05515 [Bacteroidota bacterium]|nr:hypothetical protein [Bacteroidota bacterium]MDE2833960.1 hypothetical protein [Bacteroidota bacterium]MDE2957094.1 hypothetical protein [Bacteroidota bacterium]
MSGHKLRNLDWKDNNEGCFSDRIYAQPQLPVKMARDTYGIPETAPLRRGIGDVAPNEKHI